MHSQLHRCLLCVLLSVWPIPCFVLHLWPLTQPLPRLAAILVCLEHSFWIVQQGSKPSDGFIKAWENYLKTKRALVDREVDDYLRSKASADWFTMKHIPSDEEFTEIREIVFNNLLRKSSSCLLELELLTSPQPVLNPPLDHITNIGRVAVPILHIFISLATSGHSNLPTFLHTLSYVCIAEKKCSRRPALAKILLTE